MLALCRRIALRPPSARCMSWRRLANCYKINDARRRSPWLQTFPEIWPPAGTDGGGDTCPPLEMLNSVFMLQKSPNSLPISHHHPEAFLILRLAAGPAGGAHRGPHSPPTVPKGRGGVREEDEGNGGDKGVGEYDICMPSFGKKSCGRPCPEKK